MTHDPKQLYQDLVQKVDRKFAEIAGRQAAKMHCRAKCFQCCVSGLTVSPVERDAIRSYLAEHPATLAALEKRGDLSPQGRLFCSFLDSDGQCSIYEARPVVCRSHGVPFKATSDDGVVVKDACNLNFDETVLNQIPDLDFIHLDQLNTIMALINGLLQPEAALERTLLTPTAILAP